MLGGGLATRGYFHAIQIANEEMFWRSIADYET